MRWDACPLVLALALALVGCGGRALGTDPPVGSMAPVPVAPTAGLLQPPPMSVMTGGTHGVAKQYGGYEWSSQGRTTWADAASADYAPTQALAGVAGTPCAPSASVRLAVSPPPDTAQLSLVAGPAASFATPPILNSNLAFSAPAASGTFAYRLDANWSGGRYATYFFRLKVG